MTALIVVLGQSAHCRAVSLGFDVEPVFDGTTSAGSVQLGIIDEAVVDSCSNSLTGPVTVALRSPATVVGMDGLASGTGNARVDGISLGVTFHGCSFTIVGSLEVDIDLVARSITAHDAPTQLFTSEVVGCFGQVLNGQEARVIGVFQLLEDV